MAPGRTPTDAGANGMKCYTESFPGNRTFAEFFAGIGLMRLGLEQAGWECHFANDICPDKFAMYKDNFPESDDHFRLGDIHNLKPQDVPTVALATASFPCNDLSLAGMRKGLAGSQSSAFWGFCEILRGLGSRKPPIVLLENVGGFLTSRGGADIREALLALNGLGYVVDAFIIDAERFVPQSRVRLFIIGHQFNDGVLDPQRFYESPVRPRLLADFIFSHPEIEWSIRDLPDLPKRQITLRDILEDVDPNSKIWWSEERTNYLVSQMSERHSAVLKVLMGKRAWSYGTVFRRIRNGRSMAELRADGIAGCLRTPRGGSGRQILIKAGYNKVQARLLTPRECARLMGANEYKISCPLNQALFGFGDAVCVPVVKWIADNYLNPLADRLSLPFAQLA